MASGIGRLFTSLTAFAIFAWFMAGAMLAGVLIDGLVLQRLWLWFVVPTFGLAPLTVSVAGGLVAIGFLLKGTGVFTNDDDDDDDDDDANDDGANNDDGDAPAKARSSMDSVRTSLLAIVVRPVLVLGIGWFLKTAM